MPIRTRTFRVFVSSTFEDLKAERDALQREVFPKLRRVCEQHGARFQAIDLRWGVRDEAALDQKTIDICLREIERCQRTGVKPNFIVLLGQRYGWRPLPSRIEAHEFETVRDRIAAPQDRAAMEDWYRRDDNAAPPEYLLKPRAEEWAEPERWQALEARLHGILLDAAKAAGLSGQALAKYEASATHQEILKGLGARQEDREHVFAFCRRLPDDACDPDVVGLKASLRAQLPSGNVIFYDPGDCQRLCQDVERTLQAVIESEAAGFESRPTLALEIEAHNVFARERALVFGREPVLEAISEYVGTGGGRTLVLHGRSGSGKSAVMAQASERAHTSLPFGVVIRRFIGASPESSNGLTLLRGLCEQIGEAYGATGELPVDFNAVARLFRERLGLATPERALVIFVDALDQLGKDDSTRFLDWLGGKLPASCRIVASTTELIPEMSECQLLKLETLPQADAAAALDHWLGAARRRLQPAQRERLLTAFARCGLPLYLKLAFEEARGWVSYLPPEECPLGEGVEGVIDTLLNRLSAEANHGSLLVNRGLGYLAAARYGLTEDEMLDVLSTDEEVWHDFERRAHHTPPERRLPVIVWSRLFLDLEPYLAERSAPGGTVTSFYHRQLAEHAAARFLGGDCGRLRHRSLAAYFCARPLWFDVGQSRPNARKAAELMHHQLGAGQVGETVAALTDIQFPAAKCAAGLLFDLQKDYRDAISFLPEAQAQLAAERAHAAKLEIWAQEMRDYARRCNERRDAISKEHGRLGPRLFPWLFRRIPGQPAPPERITLVDLWTEQQIETETRRRMVNPTPLDRMRVFEAFFNREANVLAEFGTRAGFVFQHAYNYAPGGAVHLAAAGQRGSIKSPVILRRWRDAPGQESESALVRTIALGHKPSHLSVTPDGRWAVTRGREDPAARGSDETVCVWDLSDGRCVRKLAVRETLSLPAGDPWRACCLRTNRCDATPDGLRAARGSGEKSVEVWDLQAGKCIRKREFGEKVGTIRLTADGRLVIGKLAPKRKRCRFFIWNTDTGGVRYLTEPPVINADYFVFKPIDATPDGRHMITVDESGFWVWNLEKGRAIRHFETANVESVALTPDGRRAASGENNGIIRIWDVDTGSCVRTLSGYAGDACSLSFAADGGRAVSASGDGTLRVWDFERRTCESWQIGRRSEVLALAVAADGQRTIAARADGFLHLWDNERVACIRSMEARLVSPYADGSYPSDHRQHFTGVAISPDGRCAVSIASSACEDAQTLRIWDLETGRSVPKPRLRNTPYNHFPIMYAVAMTPDGERVLCGNVHGDLMAVDPENSEVLSWTRAHLNKPIHSIAAAPDGRHVVSSAEDGVKIWELEAWRQVGALVGSGQEDEWKYLSVRLTPDGRRAVTWGVNHGVLLRDLNNERPVRTLASGTGRVYDVGVTPDGKRAVLAVSDNTLRLYDLETGECVGIVAGGVRWTAAQAATANRLVAGTDSGDVAIFDLEGFAEST